MYRSIDLWKFYISQTYLWRIFDLLCHTINAAQHGIPKVLVCTLGGGGVGYSEKNNVYTLRKMLTIIWKAPLLRIVSKAPLLRIVLKAPLLRIVLTFTILDTLQHCFLLVEWSMICNNKMFWYDLIPTTYSHHYAILEWTCHPYNSIMNPSVMDAWNMQVDRWAGLLSLKQLACFSVREWFEYFQWCLLVDFTA